MTRKNPKTAKKGMQRSKKPRKDPEHAAYIRKLETDTKEYTFEELNELLSQRHKDFCHEYVIDYNGTRAYRKVYNKRKEDDRSSCTSASLILRYPKIRQFIAFIKSNIAEEVGISKIGLLKELKAIAYSNLPEMYEDWITLEDLNEVKEKHPELCKAIKEISTKTERKLDAKKEPYLVNYVKISVHDKLGAIREILTSMGWKEADRINVTLEQPLFPDVTY